MANPHVEKLKALGLRHGEKAVVGLAGTLCLLFLASFFLKQTIPLTADEVAAHAKAAETNINRSEPADDILKRLEGEGLKNPGFEAMVDDQSKNALVASNYKPARPWVTLEPGAGLIRDTPALIAPIELVAYPGRGGAAVFELDDSGNRILEDPEEAKKSTDTATTARRKRKRGRNRSGGGMMGMMGGGGMMGMMGGGPPQDEAEAKKAAERKNRELQRQLAGQDKPADDEEAKEKDETPTKEAGPWKEATKGLRWVVITGTLDHKTMRANYLAALKNPTVAHPHYKQLDLERQVKQSDGSWSDWEAVDLEKNRATLFNLPEEEEELTPDEVRLSALVDPLPFLKAGYWEKVHVVSLVPKEKKKPVAPEAPGPGGMMGGMMGGRGMGGMMGGGGMPGMMGGRGMGGMMGGRGGEGMMGGRGMGGMMGGGMMGGVSTETINYEKSEADTVMVRALDLTVEPDQTYRFRSRVVVFNPNFGREDVSPGVDTKADDLFGPWSEPTTEVTMPADVTPYAMQKINSGAGSKRPDQVQFQVTRYDPTDGVTVVRMFNAGPGEIIGEPATTQVPVSDGTNAKNRTIDFISRQVVLDTEGGQKPIAPVGGSGAPLDVPAFSLLLRPDGSVAVRKQTEDLQNSVRKDMAENYTREVKESSKKRESSLGSGYGGMMGGMMGGMGGMMGGRGGR